MNRITIPTPSDPSIQELWDTIAHKAFAFFWNETSPVTGLTKDRERNGLNGDADACRVASIASTGYMLSALAIGVAREWIGREAARERALKTLRFFDAAMVQKNGFFYHFVDLHTGERAWKSEFSSIDTALLILGALTAGAYFRGEVAQRAEALYERIDWHWMQDRRKTEPEAAPLRMSWKPHYGFSRARWEQYNEASFLYLLALGAPKYALPGSTWNCWGTARTTLEGVPIPGEPGPLFWAQMAPAYYSLQGLQDGSDRPWWQLWANTHQGHYSYCAQRPQRYPRHQESLWGITACDQPPVRRGGSIGYKAQRPVDRFNNGTVAPTAALASVTFLPEIADRTLQDLFTHYRIGAWGRYGFVNAINPTRNWHSTDVTGIDLGMMLLAIENRRSGLIWRLTSTRPSTQKALNAAGFHKAR